MAEIRSSSGAMTSTEVISTGEQGRIKAGLYIVATPIGNLGDITKRSIETLKAVDVIACEDTRITGKLLNAFLIKKPMIAYHEHSAAGRLPQLLQMITEGKSVALVSDAGTPLISDPGYRLVEAAAEQDLFITTLPGASAVISALTLAGLPTNRFLFMGFAPTKTKARQDWFAAEENTAATLVYYESAKRLAGSLADALAVLGNRQAAVCREISKKFEQTVRGDLKTLVARYQADGPPKGEVVVVIAPAAQLENTISKFDLDTKGILELALQHMTVKSAATFVADITGERKKAMYQQALDIAAANKLTPPA